MSDRLEFVVDDDRLAGFAGALPVRLLAERAGLRAGLSAAMTRRGFIPGPRRATAPPLPQTGHRPREGPRPPIPADRHQHPGRADRLAGCPPPLPRARRERRQTGQGPRPQRLALPALDDQRHLDPDHRPGHEPAGLLPPARPPDGDLRDAAPKLLRYRSGSSPQGSPAGNANSGCTYARTGPGSTT
jgi:hypothetical protein